MPTQIFMVCRAPEAKPFSLETLRSLIRHIRRDAEWDIDEINPNEEGDPNERHPANV